MLTDEERLLLRSLVISKLVKLTSESSTLFINCLCNPNDEDKKVQHENVLSDIGIYESIYKKVNNGEEL